MPTAVSTLSWSALLAVLLAVGLQVFYFEDDAQLTGLRQRRAPLPGALTTYCRTEGSPNVRNFKDNLIPIFESGEYNLYSYKYGTKLNKATITANCNGYGPCRITTVIVQYGNEKYLITLAGPASKKNLNAKKYFGDILLPANRTGPLISLSDKRVSFQFADGSEFECSLGSNIHIDVKFGIPSSFLGSAGVIDDGVCNQQPQRPAKRVDYECYSRGGGLNLAPNCGARSVCRTEGDADVRNYEESLLKFKKSGIFSLAQRKQNENSALYINVQVACSILKICKITVVGVKYGPDRFNITIGGKSTNRGLRLEKIIATGKYVKASSDRQVLFEFPDGTDFECTLGDEHIDVELTIPSRLVPARTGICSQEWNTTAKDISNSANLITKYADASFPYDRDSYDDKSFEASCSKKCASIGDPHIKPFDGENFNSYEVGMVNLYRTDALKIQAYQIRFGKSNITINAALFIYRKPCDAEEYKMFSVHLGTGRRLYTASAGDDDDLIIDAKTEIVTILIGGLEGVRIVASVHGPLKNNIHYMNIYMTIGYNEFIWKNCGMCGNWFSTKPKSKCYVVPGGSSTPTIPGKTTSTRTRSPTSSPKPPTSSQRPQTSSQRPQTSSQRPQTSSSRPPTRTPRPPTSTPRPPTSTPRASSTPPSTPTTIDDCAPTTIVPDIPTPSPPICIDFGPASQFNVLVFGDYEAPSSQVQGKLAVGGDIISLDRYSVADQLPNVDRCSEVTLVVGGSVQNWTNGLNYYGNIVVGQSSPGLSLSVLYPGCCVETRENFFNFDDSRNQLIALSRDLSEYSTTVREISVKDTFLNIILNQFSGKAVINIKDPLFFIDKVKFIQPTLVENLPEGATIIFNIAGESSGLADMNMEVLQDYFVIFNFYQATSLIITGIAVRGHVLAPFADVRDASGVVYGNFYANSFSGTLQFSLEPPYLCEPPEKQTVDCSNPSPPGPTPPEEPITPQCVDLDVMSSLNALIFEDFTSGARVQGRLAVGGDANLQPGTSVGDGLKEIDQCKEATFIVGGSLKSWYSGQNYFGNIVVGTKDGSVDACRILVGGCCLLEQKNFFDFESAKSSMIDLSKHFASLPPTTKRFYVDSSETARIVFSGVEIEVINVQAANLFLTSASSIQLSDYAKGAVIVFNVYGKQTGFDAVNMEALKDLPVIFNFPDAETVTVKYTAVRGMILAPYARIEAFSGEIYGKVVAKSYNGGALGISLGASLSCSDGVKYPATCPEPEPAPYEPPLICIDLGIMRQFNGFFWEDVNVASDTQGRLAVGRDAILADGYSVADQLVGVKQCQEATLVVGGTLKWQKGQNYFGNAIVGSVANSQVNKQAVLLNNCCLVEKPDFINFEKSKLKLFEVSRALSLRRSTVTRFDSSSWIVYLSQATDIEVVHMSDLGLSNGNFNRMPTFANYLPNVPIIININGQKVSMSSHDQDSATGLPIYFNFYEAQLLTIRYIAVRGNVLAPYANIQDASGVIWGSVYARSMSGQMQINIGPSAGACPGDDKVLLPEIKCSADGPYGSTSAAPQPVSLKLWWIVYPIIALMISIVKFF